MTLFSAPYEGVLGSPDAPDFDVARDRGWLLMIYNPDINEPAGTIRLALDWPDVLAAK